MKKPTDSLSKPASIAFYLNGAVLLMGLTFGLRYLFASELMSYHLNAMSLNGWSEVVPNYRIMILTFLKVAGLGMTTASVAMGFILLNGFRRNENWARWALLCISLAHYAPILMNMIYLKVNTPATPPFIATITGLGFSATAFLLSSDMAKNQKPVLVKQA